MSEPNDSEINLDNAEDACKSDYFSDEGEVKNEQPNAENGASAKRKPTDIGLDETKKIKVSENEILTTDKVSKLQTEISLNNDFKRASSETSDNSDEFVDASDVLEPVLINDRKITISTDNVDASAVKNSASNDILKNTVELGMPKVKDNKFISRLPTFADDPLDRFNSSAIRRGFFKEAESTKPVDSNFDVNSSDKNEAKTENKVVRKVKLNRSKFFSADKPKLSDDSSSDSNSKFINSTSPIKCDVIPSNETKVSQSLKVENECTLPHVEEKVVVANESVATAPNTVDISCIVPESSSETKTECASVCVESENSSIGVKNILFEVTSSCTKEKILDELNEQSPLRTESEGVEISEENNTVPETNKICDANIDDIRTDELTQKIDEFIEQSNPSQDLKLDVIINQEINEFPINNDELHAFSQTEPESELVVPDLKTPPVELEPKSVVSDSHSNELESMSFEVDDESTEPKPQSIELEHQSIEPESLSVELGHQSTNLEPQSVQLENQSIESESQSAELETRFTKLESESQFIEPEHQSAEPEPKCFELEPQCNEPQPEFIEIEDQSSKSELHSMEVEHKSSESELQSTELDHQSIEPKPQHIGHEPVVSSPIRVEPEPICINKILPSSVESSCDPAKSSISTIVSPVTQLIDDEVSEKINDQVKKSEDDLLSLKRNSSQLPSNIESEQLESEPVRSVSESITSIESISEVDSVPKILQPTSSFNDEHIDTEKDTHSLSEAVTDLGISKADLESEKLVEMETQSHEPEAYSQNADLDITTESEDITDDKTEPDVSNEESEGEIEEEEEEEIHEEELYLEDRMPLISKPKDSTPPPESLSSPVIQNEAADAIEIDDDDDVENIVQPPDESALNSPSMEQVTESAPPSESIENVLVEKSVQRTTPLEMENIENIPMDIDEEPEPGVGEVGEQVSKELSKLEQALIGKPGIKKLEIQVPLEEAPIHFENTEERANKVDTDETKEKIKLHLSLQGDKVSIKKVPTVVTSTGEVRQKRQYRKRNKDGNVKPDKTYKLRNRAAKKEEIAAQENGQNNKCTVAAQIEEQVDLNVDKDRKGDRIYSAEPIIIDSDDSSKSGPIKVQPIKLKITKNSNVTIECGPSFAETDKNRESFEELRRKDPIPNLMEQAATAWSGPDLQRVERLLKESNITITPVMVKEASSSAPHSIMKPMLVSNKDKPTVVPKFSTPSIGSAVSSLQSATASITPISRDKYDPISELTSPQKSTHHGGEIDDHRRYGFETPTSAIDKQIDIKSEIRKMLASADKRKIEPRDLTDIECDSSDIKPKPKSVPDLVPINLPTPEMLQTLASSLVANTTAEGDSLADKSKPEIDPAFLPLLQTFPKRRGRPTKAMVAAREALKQSQEAALENLKQLATQKASEGQPIPIPILDITDPEELFKPKRGRKSRTERMDKSSDAEQSAPETTTDPEREAEEIKRLEEERIKKEEEKERRNEIRRQKARERNDLVKAKRLRQKMKAEERQKRMQEKRRKLQEEKKKLEEEIKNLPTSLPGFDDETRMSAENSQSQTMSFSVGMGDEDSSNATTELSQRVKKSRMEVTDIDSKDLTVDQIAEYQWPIQGGDLYMIQEQVSNYLGVKSFKRKYPDIKRRPVDSEERAYLVDSGLVSETLCDLGLTAVSSAEVLDIMCADFPDKYEELRKFMREKQMKELSFKQKAWANGLGYKLLMADGTKQDLKKRAMESASNWNSALNKSRSDDRRCAIDLQTFIVHYPKTRTRKMTIPTPKMGSYPVSILPGQFCDFYKSYTSTELRYMPINTVMYGPLKPHATTPGDGSQTDSDDSSSSDESSTSSEGTQATEDTIEDTDKDMSVDESLQLDKTHDINLLKEQMTMELSENTRELIMDEAAKILCKVCLGNITRNKENVPEVLIYCSQCSSTSHPTCLDLSLDMVPHIKKYAWQCPDCKSCARCKENADEDKMLFCDTCDRGYHIYCVGLKKVPSGRWQCQECTTVENNVPVNHSTAVREVFKEPGLVEMPDG